MIRVRYIVNDVDKAVQFYTSHLDFRLEQQFGPAIAILERDGLRLLVSGPTASASRPMPDGSKPSPGGWSRFQIAVDDIESVVSRLKENGVQFKNDIIDGPGVNRFFASIRRETCRAIPASLDRLLLVTAVGSGPGRSFRAALSSIDSASEDPDGYDQVNENSAG